MLQPQDAQLTAKAFTDPASQEEYWHGYLTENNRPMTARLIPLTSPYHYWISEAQLYKDFESKALMRSYGYLPKPNGLEYLALISEPASYNLASDIAAKLQQRKRYELVEIILILESCLEGLSAIFHSQLATKGHGNLTPSSIFRSMDGAYKLGNFCTVLATTRDPNGPYATYIHPHIPQSKSIQPWQADIFDLGVLLLHLCELQEPVDLKYPSVLRTPRDCKERFRRVPPEYNNEKLAELFSSLVQTNTNVGPGLILQKVANSIQEIKLSLAGQASAALQLIAAGDPGSSGGMNPLSQGVQVGAQQLVSANPHDPYQGNQFSQGHAPQRSEYNPPQQSPEGYDPQQGGHNPSQQFSQGHNYQQSGYSPPQQLLQGYDPQHAAYGQPQQSPSVLTHVQSSNPPPQEANQHLQVQQPNPDAMAVELQCKDCHRPIQVQPGAVGFICPHCFSANRLNQ